MNSKAGHSVPHRLWGSALVFALVLALEIAGAYWFFYLKGFAMADALSKTANAYYVLLMDPPNLAAMGFVWNPLPSLLQIPLLLLAPQWRPLLTHGVAGGIMTAGFAAFNSALLFRGLRHAGLGRCGSLLLSLLFVLNPFLFFYGANGMSEMPFFTMQMLCIYSLARWCERRDTLHLFLIALALAGSFLCRYEAFALALAIGIALFIMVFFARDPLSPFRKTLAMKFHYFVATALVVFMPLLIAIGVWMLLSWAIVGNPLFFTNSVYSNSAQTGYLSELMVVNSLASIMGALGMVWQKSLPFLPLYGAIVLVRLLTKQLFKPDFWVLTTLVLVLLGFHFLMLIAQKSYGWLRFYAYALPTAAAWLPHELRKLQRGSRRLAALGFALALILSGALAANCYSSQVLAPEEYEAFQKGDVSGVAQQRVMAERINDRYAGEVILMDSFMTSMLILNIEDPSHLIINTSPRFLRAVEAPQKFGVQYIVIADPTGVGALDALNLAYPGLYSAGAPWCCEVEDFGGFKIFQVLYDMPE